MCHSIYILLYCYVSSYSLVKHSVNDPIYINMIMSVNPCRFIGRVVGLSAGFPERVGLSVGFPDQSESRVHVRQGPV